MSRYDIKRASEGDGYLTMNAALVDTMLTENGDPPCAVPDDCSVCCLLSHQRPTETRRQWVERLTARVGQIEAQTAMTGGGRHG